MDSRNIGKVEKFLKRWLNSQGNERANYQMFFSELCDVLGVKQPNVKGSIPGDPYCFDKDVKIVHPSGKYTSGFIDFYKEAHFVIEAKQGSSQAGKGTAKRGTNSYRKAMKEAYYQAIAYAKSLPIKPPFILTCDIGSHFEVWQGFSNSWVGTTGDYGDYDAKREIKLSELTKTEIFDFFVTLFTDPQQLNPDVPDTVDFVMYWWHKSAQLVKDEKVNRFGLITTNSIRQIQQRKVIDFHFNQKKNPIRIFFAIPDHPWVEGGAGVRIAMTAGEVNYSQSNFLLSRLETVIDECDKQTDSLKLQIRKQNQIYSNLSCGVSVLSAIKLKSNERIAGAGVKLHGSGFLVTQDRVAQWNSDYIGDVVKRYRNGKDLLGISRELLIIDFFGKSQQESSKYSEAFQKILEDVKPERDINQRKSRKEQWWLFGENMMKTRQAINNIPRYIATPETSKHRIFIFLEKNILPDNMLIAIGLNDAYFLGVLSSCIHILWANKAGGDLIGNPRYNKSVCFDPFTFPTPTAAHKQTIKELGERLDSHRKRVQEKHPDITITGMYNLLEKIRNNELLTDKEKEYNNRALVSTLKQIHDELDAAVFDAYGWNKNLSDEEILENLVKLNAERAEEERNGLIRWLRPEYQAPEKTVKQTIVKDIEVPETETITPVEQQKWAKTFKEQLAAIRDLLRTQGGEWTETQISTQFKGKKKTGAVTNCLEILQSLGLTMSHTENHTTRYYAAELQQTGNQLD